MTSAGFIFIQWWPIESDDAYNTRHFQCSLDAFEQCRREIDSNRFVLLGLRNTEYGNPLGHQVLVYGYDNGDGQGTTQADFKRLYVYDCNNRDAETLYLLDESNKLLLFDGTSSPTRSISKARRQYWSCFVQLGLDPVHTDPLTEPNRPQYLDLTLVGPIKINGQSASSKPSRLRIGEPLKLEARVRNTGDFPAHVQSILLWARDPEGHNRDGDLGHRDSSVQTVPPGQVVTISNTISFAPGSDLGLYRFGVSYKSVQGEWLRVPLGNHGGNYEVRVSVVDAMKSRFDAAVARPRGAGQGRKDKMYFFNGDRYNRYDFVGRAVDQGYPLETARNWTGWPDEFADGIDAALLWPGGTKGYFFKGDEYLKFDFLRDAVDFGYPRKIAGPWREWPADFSSVDAALYWPGRAAYFFKDDRYLRYDVDDDRVIPGYPRRINGNWDNWPASFSSGIDAAVVREETGKIYFFKGQSYIRFDMEQDRVDSGYPLSINKGWPTL